MGGGGKGKTEASGDLADIAKQFFTETTPVRQELTDQFLEGLTTGGVGARIPIINKAVESSQRATSQSLQALDAELAKTGLAGTPFGTRARTETEQRGRTATSQVPTNFIMQMLQQIPGFVTGSNQMTIQGLTGAAGAEAQQAGAQASMLSAMMSPFQFGFMGGK